MTEQQVLLWWLPVGAGGHVVVHTSRWWEALEARRQHRRPQALFHAALEVVLDDTRHVIEMAPAWGGGRQGRGVVATGPVGMPFLGRSRLFRYEVRCWRDGTLPDRDFAVGGPVVVALSRQRALGLLEQTRHVPAHTWGRDMLHVGDMWNSNSLVSWLLETAGVDAGGLSPPGGGRAPGWGAGIAAARTDVA